MMLTWLPLVMSVLRLCVISALLAANVAALTSTATHRRRRRRLHTPPGSGDEGGLDALVVVPAVIVASLLYLGLVWTPFTLYALKQDLAHLHGTSPQAPRSWDAPKQEQKGSRVLVLRANGSLVEADKGPALTHHILAAEGVLQDTDEGSNRVIREADPTAIPHPATVTHPHSQEGEAGASPTGVGTWTLLYYPEVDYHQPPSGLHHSDETAAIRSSNEGEATSSPPVSRTGGLQDLVTSACAYSLAAIAFVRLVLPRWVAHPSGGGMLRAVPGAWWAWTLVLILTPAALTVMVRGALGHTAPRVAPHQPELSIATGYTLYSIVCDVQVSEQYVLVLFLEWAALVTLLLVGVAAGVLVRACNASRKEIHQVQQVCQPQGSSGVVVVWWARDVLLLVGALWAWPGKPALVMALLVSYGQHMTHLVCWASHLVVALAVVFMPLAVFLARPSHPRQVLPTTTTKTLGGKKCLKEKVEKVVSSTPGACNAVNSEGETEHSFKYLRLEEESKEVVTHSASERDDDKDDIGVHKALRDAHTNLKFYLGTDIWKGVRRGSHNMDDLAVILTSENPHPSISEA